MNFPSIDFAFTQRALKKIVRWKGWLHEWTKMSFVHLWVCVCIYVSCRVFGLVARIWASHARGRGSIPREGVLFWPWSLFLLKKSMLEPYARCDMEQCSACRSPNCVLLRMHFFRSCVTCVLLLALLRRRSCDHLSCESRATVVSLSLTYIHPP